MYQINIDDDSFIIADDNYELNFYKFGIFRRKMTAKGYLITNRQHYSLLDCIDGKKIRRKFSITETDNIHNYPVNSRIKLSKDIKVGDLVLGKDNQPRKVKELHTGVDEMFEITIGDTSYTVNGGHILALVDKDTNERLEMPVNIFMHMNDEFRSHYVMEKVMEDN